MAVYTILDYAIALAILFALLWFLARYLFTRIVPDKYLAIALLPTIALAITIRLLADARVYPKSQYWSVTPGVYLLGFVFGGLAITIGLLAESRWKVEYWKVALVIGVLPLPYFLAKLAPHIAHPVRALYPLLLASVVSAIVYGLSSSRARTRIFTTTSSMAIIFAHLLDASGTFVGMDFYGFYEEHPLPEFLINLTGTAAIMIPLKLTVVLAALYYLETSKEEGVEADLYYKMIKFVFFILGIGPGTRNALILTLG